MIKNSSFWKNRTVKTLLRGTQTYIFPTKTFSKNSKFLKRTLMEEIKPVVWLKNEYEYGEELKLKCFLRKSWTTRILMHGKKQGFSY